MLGLAAVWEWEEAVCLQEKCKGMDDMPVYIICCSLNCFVDIVVWFMLSSMSKK